MIITLANFKIFLGIPSTDTANDAKLSRLLAGANKNAEGWTGRDFDNGDFTERQSFGNDSIKRIYTEHIPIVSITSLTVNDSALTEDTDFYLDDKENGYIDLESSQDLSDVRSVKIVLNAGWTALTFPLDLEEAIFKLAVRTDVLTQGTLIQTGDTVLTFGIKEIKEVFDRYKR